MRLSRLTLDCLKSLRPSRVRVAEMWAAGWNETQWQVYLETRQAVEADNPGTDFRLLDYYSAWVAQHGKPDKNALRLDRLAGDLRDARVRENAVACLQTCFFGNHNGGLEV